MSVKERLLQLYKLHLIDKELSELNSLKGDLPSKIEDLTSEKKQLDERANELRAELEEIETGENVLKKENDELLERIDKNDSLLRSGAVKSNKEYDALAKEIDSATEKIKENERLLNEGSSGRKKEIENELLLIASQLEDVNTELNHNLTELEELTKQTGEEENDLNTQREELISKINTDDLEYYERINHALYGEAMAIVRKGSCLGCYSSIPPQRAIEIKAAERFFSCESCGRLLIAEELISSK
jgi:predicted  nucleic acid-binding Zn-ribbon protein